MPPDASATKARTLAAALAEFATHGLAGARVDRIAEAGQVNKRSIYVHFGNKEELFDIVVARTLQELSEDVAFTADDLPGYAGRLFDHLGRRPEILRLSTWANLERPAASQGEAAAYRAKVDAMREAQERGLLPRGVDAVDLLAMLLALVTSWAGASSALHGLHHESPQSLARLNTHRVALVDGVRRLCDAP
ncbi:MULTISPECIES: TetR family transcriptional regulator [Bacteria]|uniref:TetR family transcriptional regulator n=1 Tax=Bacteria TaxID=2 RepID=UPI003C7DEF88